MKNISYLVALHTVEGLGSARLKKLLLHFDDPKIVWLSDTKEFKKIGLPNSVLQKLNEAKKTLDPDEYFQKIIKSNIKVLTIFDDEYPKALNQIYDPPFIVYYKGSFLPSDENAVGVVGTRKVTGYGKTVTENLTKKLTEQGITIVSGLARGVDTIAHKSAIEENGRTIAVLAGGLNSIFPPENTRLAEKIASGFGVVLSEHPPSYPSLSGNFPKRNRIIAGLSRGVLVTEAAEDSGSLITARLALEYGREVFAVPGPITSGLSRGTAVLLKEGAKLVLDEQDILDELGIVKSQKLSPKIQNKLSEIETQILKTIENESKHIDQICRELKKQTSDISSALLKMEILGIVKNLGGGNYTC